MPEFEEEFLSEEEIADDSLVRKFEKFLEKSSEDNKLMVADLDLMSIVLHIRLRTIFTLEELHHRAHVIIERAEMAINSPGALRDPVTGEPMQPLLVENFQGDRGEYLEMLSSMGDAIDDEDLAELLRTDESGEEE